MTVLVQTIVKTKLNVLCFIITHFYGEWQRQKSFSQKYIFQYTFHDIRGRKYTHTTTLIHACEGEEKFHTSMRGTF